MALPQKVADQLARAPIRTQGAFGQLLMLGSTLFAMSLAIYLGLAFGYQPYLKSQIKRLDERIASFTKSVPPEDQAKLVEFYSRVVNLKTLLTNHVIFSPSFEWLEQNTQVNVYFRNLSFNPVSGRVSLSAVARSINDLSEQILILEKLPEIKEVKVSSISQNQEKFWEFGLELGIDFKAVSSFNLTGGT